MTESPNRCTRVPCQYTVRSSVSLEHRESQYSDYVLSLGRVREGRGSVTRLLQCVLLHLSYRDATECTSCAVVKLI
jgi:hypothetical protein